MGYDKKVIIRKQIIIIEILRKINIYYYKCRNMAIYTEKCGINKLANIIILLYIYFRGLVIYCERGCER
jgi:hypothetical protein